MNYHLYLHCFSMSPCQLLTEILVFIYKISLSYLIFELSWIVLENSLQIKNEEILMLYFGQDFALLGLWQFTVKHFKTHSLLNQSEVYLGGLYVHLRWYGVLDRAWTMNSSNPRAILELVLCTMDNTIALQHVEKTEWDNMWNFLLNLNVRYC